METSRRSMQCMIHHCQSVFGHLTITRWIGDLIFLANYDDIGTNIRKHYANVYPISDNWVHLIGWLLVINIQWCIALYYRPASVLHWVVQNTAADCRFGWEVHCPPVNHKVVSSTLDYRDFCNFYRATLHGLCDRNSARPSVCLSVCLSVTLVDCVHMVRPTIMISSPYGSPIILVSADITLIPKFEGGHPERGRRHTVPEWGWGGYELAIFDQ